MVCLRNISVDTLHKGDTEDDDDDDDDNNNNNNKRKPRRIEEWDILYPHLIKTYFEE
jgi:hypothetical protein